MKCIVRTGEERKRGRGTHSQSPQVTIPYKRHKPSPFPKQSDAESLVLPFLLFMLKMLVLWVLGVFFLNFLSLTAAAGQESVEVLTLHPSTLKKTSQNTGTFAVSMRAEDLKEVSASVLTAELWIRTYVLPYYPASKITYVVVGHNVLCAHDQEDKFGLILPSLENIYYALTRWGLERRIKVSTSFSSNCLDSKSGLYKEGLDKGLIRPLLGFIESTNSSYLVNPLYLKLSSDELGKSVSSHLQSMERIGFLGSRDINLILDSQKEAKPISRKLFVVSDDSKVIDPYPARPTPLARISPSSSIHYSTPAQISNSPLPPLIGTISPSPFSSRSPRHSPFTFPAAPPPFGINLPPCNPSPPVDFSAPPRPVIGSAPPPEEGGTGGGGGVRGGENLWCVAKPSVPADKLQDALDYACGDGGADCEEIQPNGNCYNPDTIVAHASFAFNSYWQKTKRNGGTCSFGGTAMIINADPSFLDCKFVVS